LTDCSRSARRCSRRPHDGLVPSRPRFANSLQSDEPDSSRTSPIRRAIGVYGAGRSRTSFQEMALRIRCSCSRPFLALFRRANHAEQGRTGKHLLVLLPVLTDTVEKGILRGPPSNIDSRRASNEQDRFKNSFARIRLFQILIPQLHFGYFFNTIDPKRSWRNNTQTLKCSPLSFIRLAL
jgi:hypothetical protein